MLNFFETISNIGPFVLHSSCYSWKIGLVELHITAGALITLAYSIAITLLYLRCRKSLPSKRLNEELQLSQTRLADILENTSDAIISIDINQRITLFNQTAEKIFGYRADEILGQPLNLLLPEQLVALHDQQLSSVKAGHDHVNRKRRELRGRRKDGTEFPAEALISTREVAGETIVTAFLHDISNRKRAEAGLSQLTAIIESSGDAIVSQSLNGTILNWNAGAERIFGYSTAEVIGQSISILVPPNYDDEASQILHHIQQGEQVEHYETVRVRKDGQLIDISITVFPIKDATGKVIGASAIKRDITKRKQAEVALHDSEERFRAFMDNSPAAAWITDGNGQILYFNNTYSRMFKVPVSDLVGIIDITIFPDEISQEYLTNIRKVVETNQAIEVIEPAPLPDGTLGEFLVYKFPITSSSKQPLVGGVAIDITERRQAEEQLRRSEITKRAMIQAIPDLLIRMRRDGTQLELINPGCVHFVGPESSFVGSNVRDILPSNVAYERLRCVEQALQTGEVQFHEYQLNVDGQQYYEEARVVSLQNDDVLMVVRDITDRKQTEQALRESEARFRTLIEDLHVGVVVHGAQAEVLLSNSKALDLLGLTEAQFLGKTAFNLDWNVIHECGAPITAEVYPVPQAIANRCSVRNVIMGVHRPTQGDCVWLLVDAEPQFAEDGSVQQVICTFSDISDRQAALRERERAEAELQQREREFRALVENAPDIIMRLDQACRYLYINPTIERRLRIPTSAFINQTIDTLGVSESFIELWRTKIQQVFETGQEQKLEFEIPTSTELIYYATRVVPEFADDGSVQSVLAIARDISDYVQILQDREQAEALLRQSEARLRLALKAAKFGTWEFNFVTRELFQSDISEIYGLEPGQTHKTYEQWQAQVHPDDLEWVEAEFNHAVQTEREFNVEFRIVRLDGTVRWTLSTGAIVRDQTNQPLYAYGVSADITDRKRAEVELKAQQAFLRQIIDVVPNVIFVKDKEGRILTVNQAGAAVHGTTVEAMIGKREIDFNPNFTLEQLEEFLAINRQVMQTQQPHRILTQSVVATNGEICWYQTVINPLIDVTGQVTGIVGATTDITDLKHIEQALQQAKEAAEAANKAKSIFLANMSHELRTPLNVILGFAQVMYRDPLLTSEQRENLRVIRRSGDHLLSLINDVLDLSKIEAGHVTLDGSSINLVDLLQSLEQMFRQPAKAKGLQLQLELASELPQYVTIDANKLRQVLINLLGNAIKFTEQGGVVLRVSRIANLECKIQNEGSPFLVPYSQMTIHFEVIDTGIGIAPSELGTIFNAFVQTQAGKISPDGTGLGLTISRKFVQIMGGELTVRSTIGQGSIFAFTLPVRLTPSTDISAAASACQVIGLALDQPTYRILVVDDQPENRKLLVKRLSQIGLEVREATDGQDAVNQWHQWRPDLIWMDIRMPILNGYEATQQIRATPGGQVPVIIALTAQASSTDRILALSAGCNDYLSKPFQEEELFSKMAEHLGLTYLCVKKTVLADVELLNSPVTLHASDLLAMPSTWIAELRHAARLCDDNEIAQLIEQIPPEQVAVANGLRQLVQNYKFKQIIDLTTPGSTDASA